MVQEIDNPVTLRHLLPFVVNGLEDTKSKYSEGAIIFFDSNYTELNVMEHLFDKLPDTMDEFATKKYVPAQAALKRSEWPAHVFVDCVRKYPMLLHSYEGRYTNLANLLAGDKVQLVTTDWLKKNAVQLNKEVS